MVKDKNILYTMSYACRYLREVFLLLVTVCRLEVIIVNGRINVSLITKPLYCTSEKKNKQKKLKRRGGGAGF